MIINANNHRNVKHDAINDIFDIDNLTIQKLISKSFPIGHAFKNQKHQNLQ